MHRNHPLPLLFTWLLACGGPPSSSAPPSKAPDSTALAEESAAETLKPCKSEVIALPPDFAPSLPSGTEEVFFSPGMFDAQAPDYFTYEMNLSFDEIQALSPESLDKFFTEYFVGLMTAVAKDKGKTHDAAKTRVEIRPTDLSGHEVNCRAKGCVNSNQFFDGVVHTADEFGSGTAIEIVLLIDASPNRVRVVALPRALYRGQSIVYGSSEEFTSFSPLLCRPE